MGAAQFQGFVAADGRVETEQTPAGVVPAGSTVLRGMAVTSAGKVLITQDTGQPRTFMNGIAFERDTGIVLFGNAPPLNISHGGLLVDVNGAVVMTVNAPDVIHQGVGLTNAGELCVEQLGCFFIVSAQIGDPNPDEIFITYNEPFDDTTCSDALNWLFQYNAENFDVTVPLPPESATVDAWRVRNTLEDKDGASPSDAVTLSYTPGTCSKSGDPTCDLKQVTNYPVTNNILGPSDLEIGDTNNTDIVVDFPVDITTLGSTEYWSVEDSGGPILGITVLLIGGDVILRLPSAGDENETYFVTYDPVNYSAGAQSSDGRYQYKYFGKAVVNNIDTTAPSVPTGLTAAATGQTTIDLSWNPSTDSKSGMKEYVIYRASVEIDRVPHPTTTYQDTGLSPETAYSYTVSAVDNKDNESAQSVSDSATTWQPAPLVVSAEVGNVADNIVVVTFDREVVAANYAQGWTFTEDTSPQTISSANKTLATEVQFTLAADISNGTIVAYAYNGTTGNYENTDGVDMASESGSVTNNVAPPVAGPDFVAYAADTNGVMRALETGSGSVMFNRSTTATVATGPDNFIRECKANEIRFQGARREENLATDLVTETYVETIVIGDEYQLTIAGDNGATAVCTGAFTGTLTADGVNRISWPNGTPKTATTTSLTITVTGTLTEKMLENVSGDIDQNPSEYIPAGEADGTPFSYAGGVRYYNYRKGNTVDGAGVVTEAKGTDLPAGSIKALIETGTTNRSRNSQDFTFATWSKSSCTIDADVTISPDGRQNADRLNVTPGTNVQTKVFFNLSASSGPQTHSVWVKDDGAGYACVYLFAADGNSYTVTFDLSTGAVTDENIGASTTETRNSATDWGNGWWLLEIAGNFGSIGALFQQVSASSTPTPGFSSGQPVNSPVEGEDIFIWGAQNEQIKNSTSYLPTGDVIRNRTADDASPTFDIANFNQLSGTRVARVKFNGLASGDETLVEGVNGELLNMLTMQDGTMKSTDGTGTSVSPSMGGDASKEFYVAVNYVNGQPLEVGFRNITDAGSWQWPAAPVTYDGAFVTDNNIHVGFGQNVVLEISDLHGYLSAIGKAQIESTY